VIDGGGREGYVGAVFSLLLRVDMGDRVIADSPDPNEGVVNSRDGAEEAFDAISDRAQALVGGYRVASLSRSMVSTISKTCCGSICPADNGRRQADLSAITGVD
jgi:hypothetical protein